MAVISSSLVLLQSSPANAAGPLTAFASGPEVYANEAVFDPVSGLVFASVRSTDSAYPNRVVAFSPATGEVSWSVVVGSEPNAIAVADDGSSVYVGLDGEASVARIDTGSRSVVNTFSLGGGVYGAHYAEDIEVLPGDPDTIIVSLFRNPSRPFHAGVARFTNGAIVKCSG